MAGKNSIGSFYANNADGWEMTGGTTGRKLKVSGSDIIIAGSGSSVLTFPPGTDNIMGEINNLAAQSDQETGTSTTKYVSPGRQHFHPGHPKCWAQATVSSGTPTLQTSYNITSITDSALGSLTITIGNDFSSANWCSLCSVGMLSASLGTGSARNVRVSGSLAAGSIVLDCIDSAITAGANLRKDPDSWYFAGFGDL